MADYVRMKCMKCSREHTFTCEVPSTVMCQGCGSSHMVAVDPMRVTCKVCGEKASFNVADGDSFFFVHNAPNCKSYMWVLLPLDLGEEPTTTENDVPPPKVEEPVPAEKLEERKKQLVEKKLEVSDVLTILAPLNRKTKRDVIASALQNLRAMGIPLFPKVRNLETISKATLWSAVRDLQKQFTALNNQ